MGRTKTRTTSGSTLAERAYRAVKHGILHGEFPEGSFLVESEILSRFTIGRTPFREACNRLHNEHLLEVVPRRGYLVPELSFRAVRDLLETRIVLEGIAAELAALRAEPVEVDALEAAYKETIKAAKAGAGLDAFLEANQKFHLQIARMSHNIEFEALLRGVLERSTRLVYLAAQSAQEMPKDVEALLKPIVEAVRRRDAVAAHDAVVRDITQGQLNALGRDVWGAGAGVRRNGALLESAKGTAARRQSKQEFA
ncbi:MAG TPA: GntR family transcriptional regulator [Bryobacteraceae bacterium]|jgi:DNA-binding GntR family transcriptional regulator|nr:GntR family transcriptional regulator [Bryobacteraceae bacterium]